MDSRNKGRQLTLDEVNNLQNKKRVYIIPNKDYLTIRPEEEGLARVRLIEFKDGTAHINIIPKGKPEWHCFIFDRGNYDDWHREELVDIYEWVK